MTRIHDVIMRVEWPANLLDWLIAQDLPDVSPLRTHARRQVPPGCRSFSTRALGYRQRHGVESTKAWHTIERLLRPSHGLAGEGEPQTRRSGWLASSNDSEALTSGGYWYHRQRQRPHPAVLDQAFQDLLLKALSVETGVPLGEATH